MKFAVTTAFFAGLLRSVSAQDPTVTTTTADPCSIALPTIGPYLDVTYTSAPENIVTWFAADKGDSKDYDISLQFEYTSYTMGTTQTEDMSEFAAIVWAGPECGTSGEIIATYGNADYASTYQTDSSNIFDLTIDGPPDAPVVKFGGVDFNNWRPPFYTQEESCSDSVGTTTNPSDQTCGKLEFCIELQVLLCGKKVDFVDVGVEIELDIEVSCETDCVDVTLKRAKQVGAEADASAEYPVECYACEVAPHACPDPDTCRGSYEITQGTPMEVCIALSPDVDGACIVEIESLNLEVNINGVYGLFQILPTCVFPQCLFPALNGKDLNPVWDIDAVSVGFQPPAWVFQEVTPGSSLQASFKGTVILGFGCYCYDDPSDPMHCDNVTPTRKLQSSTLAISNFNTAADLVTAAAPAPTGCSLGALFA